MSKKKRCLAEGLLACDQGQDQPHRDLVEVLEEDLDPGRDLLVVIDGDCPQEGVTHHQDVQDPLTDTDVLRVHLHHHVAQDHLTVKDDLRPLTDEDLLGLHVAFPDLVLDHPSIITDITEHQL